MALKESEIEFLRSTKVLYATPCYGGMCAEPYFRGMIELVGLLSRYSIPYIVGSITNESLITRARNTLVKEFLSTDATHLFFIDADIRFDAVDAVGMILKDKPIVAATYPLKFFNVDNLVGKKFNTAEEIHMASAKYVTNFVFEDEQEEGERNLTVVDGLVEVYDAGTGFMCIKREVIERLIEEYPETEYIPEGSQSSVYALFDTIIDEDKRYLSEDYTFCRRWQKIGGKVWLDPTVVLDHFGSVLFRGQNIFTLR